MNMKRMDITIVVNTPEGTEEKHVEFVEGVMAVFRAVFPDAEALPRTGIDTPAPVTVTFHEKEAEEVKPDPGSKKVRIPTHEEILKAMEEDDTPPADVNMNPGQG